MAFAKENNHDSSQSLFTEYNLQHNVANTLSMACQHSPPPPRPANIAQGGYFLG